jgi:hypothetical protein
MRNGLIVGNNVKRWYLNDLLHREDGPAIEYTYGRKCWYLYGKLHREGGPAVEDGEHFEYLLYGKLHRLDGPAINFVNNSKEWWIDNRYIPVNSQKEFEQYIKLIAFT